MKKQWDAYVSIQDHGQKVRKVRNFYIFKVYLLPVYSEGWQVTTGSYTKAHHLNFLGWIFHILSWLLGRMILNLDENYEKSTKLTVDPSVLLLLSAC